MVAHRMQVDLILGSDNPEMRVENGDEKIRIIY